MTKAELVMILIALVLMAGIWGLAAYQIDQSRAELQSIHEFCQSVSNNCPDVP